MQEKQLWNKFLSTGKVEDYLAYTKAKANLDLYSNEISQEFLGEGESIYDHQDNWNCDS